MTTDNTEPRLRQLFRDQREQDARQAPGFAGLVSPAAVGQRPTFWATVPWVRLAAAAVIVVVGVIILHPSRPPSGPAEADWTQWAALSEWQAPTDALLTGSLPSASGTLTTPSDAWLSSLATVSDTASSTNPKEKL